MKKTEAREYFLLWLMYEICALGRVFGVRKPRLRFRSPKPCFGLEGGEARLRPEKAGAWLPHSKHQKHKSWT
jgi:hypothetical protein